MKNLIFIIFITLLLLSSLLVFATNTHITDIYVNTTTLYGNLDMGYIQNGELNCSSNYYVTGISTHGKNLYCIQESWLEQSGGTMTGNISMNNNLITNIGNTGTDFDVNGGLTLAGNLTVNNMNTQSGNIMTNATCLSIVGLTSTLNIC